LRAVDAGERFGAAVAAGGAQELQAGANVGDDDAFDAAAALQRFVIAGAIVDFQ
jgi:hypothetical protein